MRLKTAVYLGVGGAVVGWLLLFSPGASTGGEELPAAQAPQATVADAAMGDLEDLEARRVDAPLGPLVGVVAAREPLDLVASEAGRVAAVKVGPGDRVRQGEVVAEMALDDLDLERQAEEARVREAGVAVERTRLAVEVDRRRASRRASHPDLFSLEDRERVELELESALLELQEAMARQREAEARLRLLRRRITRREIVAPLDGLVSERFVDPGSAVSAGQAVLQLVDPEERIVRFAAPAEQHKRFTVGMAVRVFSAQDDPSAAATCATVERISPKVEPSAPLILLEAGLEEGVWSGTPLGTAVAVSPDPEPGCASEQKEGTLADAAP